MELTKEQIVDKAVEVVSDLNRIVQGLFLNGRVCAVKGSKNELKDCFLARAKDLIFNATREQLADAYDECVKAGLTVVSACNHDTEKAIVENMFKVIGNKAHNPDNEALIESVRFGYV